MDRFGKVAVLMGGWSAEREVSLKSGAAVLQGLLNKGVDAQGIDVDRNIVEKLEGFDRVFNILHGRGGEDGQVQGMLDVMQLPYTGSGILGSAIAMDKLLTKQIWKSMGLPTPDYLVLADEKDCDRVVEELGLPVMIKPVLEGSSIGMSKVNNASDVKLAWQTASECKGVVIAEKFVQGKEYTAAILNDRVLPFIRLETPRDFYDYQAKYVSDDTSYVCPCGLNGAVEAELGDLMLKAFKAVHAEGWGRVDFIMDDEANPWLIEVNTVPGMTDHSLVPMAAKQAGIGFDDLVVTILEGSLNK